MENTKTEQARDVLLEVVVSRELYEKLKTQAKNADTDVSTVLRRKMIMYGHLDSTKPIVIDDTARRHLEKLLARNLTTADELVACVQRSLSATINGVEVSLEPRLLEHLRSRCIGMDFDKFIVMMVKRLLEEHVGLR